MASAGSSINDVVEALDSAPCLRISSVAVTTSSLKPSYRYLTWTFFFQVPVKRLLLRRRQDSVALSESVL
ncbi:hypothetical protein BDR22DRAFT_506324 [Usnea florida]